MGTGKLLGQPDRMLGVTCDGLASHPGRVAILLVASCYRNRSYVPGAMSQLGLKGFTLKNLNVSFYFTFLEILFKD